MKKFGKFLVTIVSIGAACAAGYYVVKNFLLKDSYEDIDDFDDVFDDDFDEDFDDLEQEEDVIFDDSDEVPVTMESGETTQE